MQHAEGYTCYVPKAKPSDLYPLAYNFKLINTIDELKEALLPSVRYMAFDTETTGLNPERNFIVGYSFCLDGKTAYYVPVKHALAGLGDYALDLIYEKMCNTESVAMFNMRFDVRMMEYCGFIESDLSWEEKLKKQFFKYDMSKVNVIDVQAMVYLADTNIKFPSLKASEEWYLGWRGASFEETLGDNNTFYYLSPEEACQYAATDALGTYLLGIKMQPFLKEAKTSGILDLKSLQPLTRFENETTYIDTVKLQKYSDDLSSRIHDVQEECYDIAGYPFNIGSTKDKTMVLERLGIYTGGRTKKGEMKTGKYDIENTLKNLDKNSKEYRFLSDLSEYGTLVKQKSSYVDNVLEMCKNEFHPNRLRFGYKTCEVPSGRLAAGGDKKNDFFANLNIQNITKPHAKMYFVQHQDKVKTKYPDMIKKLDESGTFEECEYDGAWCFRILGWIFWDKPFELEGEQEMQSEGFNQNLNIRSAFCADKDCYWVSLDFNAEEIRVPALITKEPVWLNTFISGGDVHRNCYSLDTEILTKNGFKKYNEINEDTLIAQYDPEIDKITFVEAGPVYYNETSDMYHFSGESSDLLVTPNHRVPYISKNKELKVKTAEEIYKLKNFRVLNNAPIDYEDTDLKDVCIDLGSNYGTFSISVKDFCRLAGLVLSDDSFIKDRKIHKNSLNVKSRFFIDEMKKLNISLNDIFDEFSDGFSYTWCTAYNKLWDFLDNTFKNGLPDWFKMLPNDCLDEFIRCIALSSGTFDWRSGRNKLYVYISNNTILADLQDIALKCGYVSSIDSDRILLQKRRTSIIESKGYEIIHYDSPVKSFCFSVPSTFLVVRRNGKVTICGNTAIALWGEENYSRDKRKMAKGANFGILYGQNARNFAENFNISMEEAQEFVTRFKTSLPVLFSWVAKHEENGARNGTVYTLFGRPRRVAYWMHNPQKSLVAFGKRTCVNTTIQGTGADILKIAFIKIFKTFYSPKDYRAFVRFLNTVHDEINYNVRKDAMSIIVPRLIKCMRLQLSTWEFPMEVGLGIGTRWGQCIDFVFDTSNFSIIKPKMEEYHPKESHEEVPKETKEQSDTPVEELPKLNF